MCWGLSYIEDHTTDNASDGRDPSKKINLSIKQYVSGLLELVRNPHILVLTLATGFRAMTQTAILTFLPSIFMNVWSFSPLLSGVGLAFMNLSGTVATPISGKISDRHGRKKVARMGLLFSAIAVIVIIFVRISFLQVVTLGVLGFFLYSLRPVFIAWAMELAPKGYSGSIVAFTFIGQSFLSSTVPLIGGWIADTWSITATLYLIVVTIIAAELLVITVPEGKDTK
jgi:sugar phosphate permease